MRRALLVALCLIAPFAAAAPAAMQPGLWEVTVSVDMPNIPVKMPPQTVRQCVRKEDLADSKKMVPASSDCKVDSVKESGNTFSWSSSCKGQMGDMKGSGQMTFSGQSYTGQMSMSGKMDGEAFSMKQTYAGRRVGDCK